MDSAGSDGTDRSGGAVGAGAGDDARSDADVDARSDADVDAPGDAEVRSGPRVQVTSEVEVVDGEVTWRFDRAFLTSNWTCTWGRGCQGILDRPAPELQQGCCSVGAQIDGDDEARRVAGLAATLDPAGFQFHAEAADAIFEVREGAPNTRVVDGACIFLNRPGFAGGAGCALHLAAVADDESPIDWKPSVCWQLPVKVDWSERGDGGEVARVRAWTRADWGDDGDPMAWCCTTDEGAYVGDRPVVESLADELDALVGPEVRVELHRRLTRSDPDPC